MRVEEIVKLYLEANGYDGLCCSDCGCALDDLFPCGDVPLDCVPGYKVPCMCGDHDFDICAEKREP